MSTRFFLILNPDLKIDEKSIVNMYDILNQYSDCAIVAPVTRFSKDFYGAFPERNIKNLTLKNALKSRNLLLNSKSFDLIFEVLKFPFGIEKLNIPRSSLTAITHVDYSARIQSVSKKTNKRYHEMLTVFKEKYGCPVVVNTSFNVRGEPIVCTPSDAYRCFMRTEMDILVLQNQILYKENQINVKMNENWFQEFTLD